MTKKRDLKAIIRARMEKTGESFMEARRNVMTQAGKLCPACGTVLETRVVRRMAELDDDATEGQMADHMAAELSGDFGDWEVEETHVFCPRCEPPIVRALEALATRGYDGDGADDDSDE